MRLDNAALIYPPCKSRAYSPGFRICVTLDEDIDPDLLQQALEEVLRRFPSFAYTIGKNFLWWYLKRMKVSPEVRRSVPFGNFDYEKNGGWLFRVGYDGPRIDLDVFHALTDGTGAMTFLMSLAARYLHLRHGTPVEAGRWVKDPDEEPCEEEIEDGFDHFSGMKGSLDKETAAFALRGEALPSDEVGHTCIRLDLREMEARARRFGCTVTEYLTAEMLCSLQEVRGRTGSPFLRVEVPVNLRPIFCRRTLRNFSSYLHIGIDVRNGNMSFGDILADVRLQKSLYLQPERLAIRVAANVELEDNKFIALIPRFIKKPVMRLIYHLKGDKYCSTTLSNIGRLELPESMAGHVRDVDFLLGRPLKRGVVCGCVSFGGTLSLNFTSRIRDRRFEQAFERNLRLRGKE